VEPGGFLVLDAGSSNGTSINGRNVLTKGAGPPTPLRPGDTLRLGRLEFTFAHGAALRELAAKLR
jgi:pSer/pThr/pTyr-binding forkhead associated (FHA) protein